MKRSAAVLALASATVVVAGCATSDPVQAPYTPQGDYITQANYPKVTMDGRLAGFIAVEEPKVKQEGPLEVTTPIRLLSHAGHWSKIQYRYIFLDSSGVPLRVQPDWQPRTLEARQAVFLTGNALDTTAVDWRLEIRPQR